MPKGSVSFEVFVRSAAKIDAEDKDEMRKLKNFRGLKKYLCMDCAAAMLDEALQDVQTIRLHGADGYKLLKGI